MEMRMRQRLIGASVIVALAAIFLPMLFYHALPEVKSVTSATAAIDKPASAAKVYNIPLQGQAVFSKTDIAQDNIIPVNAVIEENDLRKKAAETGAISARLLHAPIIPRPVTAHVTVKHPVVMEATAHKRTIKQITITSAIPPAWVLKVGSFNDEKNATAVVAKLQKMHLDVYLKRVNTRMTQVYIGPYIQYTVVKQLQQQLQHQLHLNGVIKKYHSS